MEFEPHCAAGLQQPFKVHPKPLVVTQLPCCRLGGSMICVYIYTYICIYKI
jgi:hypothetical protein